MGAVWSSLQVKTKLPEGNPGNQLQHLMLKRVPREQPRHAAGLHQPGDP